MEIIILILLIALIGLVAFSIIRKPEPPAQDVAPLLQAIYAVKEGTNQAIIQAMQSSSETVSKTIDNVLRAVGDSQKSVTDSTGQVGIRLDSAAKVIGEVQSRLGELSQATKEIKELGQSVSALQQLLQAPKLRGGFGEMLLEDLLHQVLPSDHFEMQHRFRNGNTVDALIKTAQGSISVDSKFPFENFKRAVEAQSDNDKRLAARTFISDVKKHIDAICSKYILPDEGTFGFAIMYIPVESIYYELIVRDGDSLDVTGEVAKYALERKIIPVSPSSFYAYLVSIAYGLKGLEIEKNAQTIINGVARLSGEVEKFMGIYSTLGAHLKNAQAKFDDGVKQVSMVEAKVKQLSQAEAAEALLQ